MELCGGTHVRATGDIGLFLITQESGVAAGVRRIEALTGLGAYEHVHREHRELDRIVHALHVNPDQATDAIERLQSDQKRLSREVTDLKTKLAMGGGSTSGAEDLVEIDGVKLARRKVSGLDKGALRGVADSLKERLRSGIVIVASEQDGKVSMVVSVTPDLKGRVPAGQVIKQIAPIVGGGGGGRPDFAEAGGKHPEKIDEMLEASERTVRELLAGR
jgi:alanyl-tRNA synthetase